MRSILISGRPIATRARSWISELARVEDLVVETMRPGRGGELLKQMAGARPALAVHRVGDPDGPIGLDATAMILARAAPCPVLILRAGDPWPPRRVVLPVTMAEMRSASLAEAARQLAWTLRADEGLPLPSLELLHLPRDSDEWYEGRTRLQEQITALGGQAQVTSRSCMRFGAPVARRALQALAADQPELTLLLRPPAGESFHRGSAGSEWMRIAGGCRSSLLVLPPFHPAPPGFAAKARAEEPR